VVFDLGGNWHLSDKCWNVPGCPWGTVGIFHSNKPLVNSLDHGQTPAKCTKALISC